MSDIKVIETKDGSSSLLIPEMNETYHSTHGAMTESEHVFLKMGLDYFNQNFPATKEIKILEIGFGTGLNAWLTALSTKAGKTRISYVSIEKFPLSTALIDQLNYKELKNDGEAGELFERIHEADWDLSVPITESFDLTKIKADVRDYTSKEGKFDLVYFDAFAPSRQPEMWTVDVLGQMYDLLGDNGVFVTYCAQGQFKRDLKAVGFEIESLDGPPGKKEMTRGTKVSVK